MSAIDILTKLDGSHASDLGSLQRVLLITDGTVTEILEATFLERMQLIKVAQQVIRATAADRRFDPKEGERLLKRRILLRGSETGRNYAYAESQIALDRLDPSFCEKLIKSHIPLGRLWLEYKLETFKELLEVGCRRADDLSPYFGCAETSSMLVRTYRVFSGGRVVMLIAEYFPARYNQATACGTDNRVGAPELFEVLQG